MRVDEVVLVGGGEAATSWRKGWYPTETRCEKGKRDGSDQVAFDS